MTQEHDNDVNTPAANQPVDVLRDTNLKAAIWRNEADKGPFYATTFARTYKEPDGTYRDTHSFVAADLLRLSELARKAYDRTTELRREDREQARGAQPAADGEQRTAFREKRSAEMASRSSKVRSK